MVKKKAEANNDLTRIEDLQEFTHEDNTEIDTMFENFEARESNEKKSSDSNSAFSTEENSEPEISFDSGVEENQEEVQEENESNEGEESNNFIFDTSALDSNDESTDESENSESLSSFFDSSSESLEESLEETSNEESNQGTAFGAETSYESSEDRTDPNYLLPDMGEDESESNEVEETEVYAHIPERFEEVRAFAQNFSYGRVSMKGGNPPYTIIARQIKYEDDASDILDLLSEFGIVNDDNIKDVQMSLEFGSLIIPQISEYTAIVLAHKLRRFDLDLEVGLSDEVHPSKSGDSNPKGLLKKDNAKQNRTESVNLREISSIKDIIVSTMASVPGYYVEEYIGVQTTFSIVEEAELERLQYVEKTQREHAELYDYNSADLTTEQAFKDYQNSFALLYDDLALQLKQKAITRKANALLGLSFQLSPLQFERSHLRVNAYQITCSATLAIVGKEKG